jgi:hypothetical protein
MADPKTTDSPPTDKPPAAPSEKENIPSHLTVLILRDDRVGNTDYKPGDTPKLSYDEAQRLIKRGGADADSGAVKAARTARKAPADEQE